MPRIEVKMGALLQRLRPIPMTFWTTVDLQFGPENGGAKFVHGSVGMKLLRAA